MRGWKLGLAAVVVMVGCGARAPLDDWSAGVTSSGAGGATSSTVTTTITSGGGATTSSVVTTTTSSAATTSSTSTGAGGGAVALGKFDRPFAIELDDAYVYVTEMGSTGLSGKVTRIPKSGGAPEVLVSGLSGPAFLALTADDVFFANSDLGDSLQSVPKKGGPKKVIGASENCGGLTSDSALVYCTKYYEGTVSSFDVLGNETNLGATGADTARGPLVDASNLYWHAETLGGIGRMPKTGGASTNLTPPDAYVDGMAQDATTLYFSQRQPAEGVFSVPKAGGPETMVAAEALPYGGLSLAVDDTTLYWTHITTGELRAVAKGGGSATTLVSGMGSPTSLKIDAAALYWVDQDDGVIWKLPK